MRRIIPALGITLIVIGLLASVFIISPVVKSGTEGADVNNDGTAESSYSVLATLLNDGAIINEHPFSLTYEGAQVTDIRISASWVVTIDPPGSLDLSTLEIDGEAKLEYWASDGVPPGWVLIDNIPFTSQNSDDSWFTLIPLSDLLTSSRTLQGSDTPTWNIRVTVKIGASVASPDGSAYQDSVTPLSATFQFHEDTTTTTTTTTTTNTETTFILDATSMGVVMDSLGGGFAGNPVWALVIAGIVFLPLGFCLGRKG